MLTQWLKSCCLCNPSKSFVIQFVKKTKTHGRQKSEPLKNKYILILNWWKSEATISYAKPAQEIVM